MLLGQIRQNLENSSESVQIRALQEALRLGQEGISLFAHYSVEDTPKKVRQASYWLLLGYNPVEDPEEKYFPTDTISCVVISPDHRLVIGGSWQFLYVWDFKTGKLLHKLSAHSHWVLSVAIDEASNTLVSSSADGTIAIWDLESWRCKSQWKAHQTWVTKVAIASKQRQIISSSLDGAISVWKLKDQPPTQPEFYLQDRGEAVWSFDIDCSETSLISGGADGKLKIWDLTSRKVIQIIEDSKQDVRGISRAQDIYSFWVSRSDNTLEHWRGYTPIPDSIKICVLMSFLPIEYFLNSPLIYKILCELCFLALGGFTVFCLNKTFNRNKTFKFNKLNFQKTINSKNSLAARIISKLQDLRIVELHEYLYKIKITNEKLLSLLNKSVGIISSIAINSNSKVFICAGLNWLTAWETSNKKLDHDFEGATYLKPASIEIQIKLANSKVLTDENLEFKQGESVQIELVGYDRNKKPIEVKNYQWEPQEYIFDNKLITNKPEGTYTLTAHSGTEQAKITFSLLRRPILKTFKINPKNECINTKSSKTKYIQFSWQALDQYNEPFPLNEDQIIWQATEGDIENGNYTVPKQSGDFTVTASVNNTNIFDTATVKKLEQPQLKHLVIEPKPEILYCGETYHFKARGINQHDQPFTCCNLKWKFDGGKIQWGDSTAIVTPKKTKDRATISVRQDSVFAEIYVQLVSKIKLDRLQISPSSLNLPPGQRQKLTVRGWDQNGDAFDLNQQKLVWTVTRGDATVDVKGVLTGGSQNARVRVECLGKKDILEVGVIEPPRPPKIEPTEVEPDLGQREPEEPTQPPTQAKSEPTEIEPNLGQREPEKPTQPPTQAKIERIEIEPNLVKLKPEEQVSLQVVGFDTAGNRRPISPQDVSWNCDVGGYINHRGLFHFQGGRYQHFVKVYATFRELYAELSIEQLSVLTRLEIQPKTVVELYPREQQQFEVFGFDQFDQPVKDIAVEWDSLAGEFNAEGVLTVDTEIADYYNVTARASRSSHAPLSLNIKLIGEYLQIASKILKFLSSRKFDRLVNGIQNFIPEDDETIWSKFVDSLELSPDERFALKLLAKVLHEIAKICINQNTIYISAKTYVLIKETEQEESSFYNHTIFRNACYTSDTEEGEQPFATDIYGTTSENWYQKKQASKHSENYLEEQNKPERLVCLNTTWSTIVSGADPNSKLPSCKYYLETSYEDQEVYDEDDGLMDINDINEYALQDELDYHEYIRDKMNDAM